MSMRILRLTARNVKRLQAVEITPTGDLVVISGANGQGKSSVLDAIALALGGKNAVKGLTRPVRDGETEAQATVQVGPYTITRSWVTDGEETTSTLTVRDETGRVVKSPQRVLDEIVGDLSIDPLRFAEADAKTQRTMLLSVSDVDQAALDRLEGERAVAFEKRTEVTRRIRALDGQYDALPIVPVGTPAEETSASDALAALTAAQERIAEVGALQAAVTLATEKRDGIAEQVRHMEGVLATMRAQLQPAEDALAAAADAAVDPADLELRQRALTKAQAAVAGLDAHNALVRQGIARTQAAAQVKAARAEHEALTAEVEGAIRAKADLLGDAHLPVPGIGLDDDGTVTYQGVPLSQASSAERLRVSVAVAIAANPEVRVIHVKDGSLLDRGSMAALAELAAAHDAQVWVERVEDDDPAAFVIEDGSLRGAE